METFNCSVEVREAKDGPRLHGILLPEGRAAQGGRAELFVPGAMVWPSEGVKILAKHRGSELARTVSNPGRGWLPSHPNRRNRRDPRSLQNPQVFSVEFISSAR